MVNEGYANAISFSSYRNDTRIDDAVSVEELSFDEEVLPLESDMELNTIANNVETASLTTTEKLNSSEDDGI